MSKLVYTCIGSYTRDVKTRVHMYLLLYKGRQNLCTHVLAHIQGTSKLVYTCIGSYTRDIKTRVHMYLLLYQGRQNSCTHVFALIQGTSKLVYTCIDSYTRDSCTHVLHFKESNQKNVRDRQRQMVLNNVYTCTHTRVFPEIHANVQYN